MSLRLLQQLFSGRMSGIGKKRHSGMGLDRRHDKNGPNWIRVYKRRYESPNAK